MTHGIAPSHPVPDTSINIHDHPFLDSPPHIFQISLPPTGTTLGITIKECNYHKLPYIASSTHGSLFQQAVPHELRHNVWVLAIGNNNPITEQQVRKDFIAHQHPNRRSDPIQMVIAKRNSKPPPTLLQHQWAAFDQLRIVPHQIIPASDLPPIKSQHNTPSQQTNDLISTPLPPILEPTQDTLENTSVQLQHQDNDDSITSEDTDQQHIEQSKSNQPTVQEPKQNHTTEFTVRRSKRSKIPSQFLTYPSEATEDILHKAIVSRLIHHPNRPEKPDHMGAALKSSLRTQWIDCLFDTYDKMHKSSSLSLPFETTLLPKDTTILRPRITCEVKITDSADYYEMKCRMCADGSRMIMGLDYDLSYAPVIDGDSLLLMIALATSKSMVFYFLDISNAFQTNVIHDPSKRHYLHLPTLYMQWFKLRFPHHPLNKLDHTKTKLVLQTIRGIQGTKDAGAEWYKLLALIFTKVLGMVPSPANKGLFYWSKHNQEAYIALATDDILMASTSVILFHELCTTFNQYFDYTTAQGSTLHFLNYRIIQSKHGTSIEQYSHIRQNIISPFFNTSSTVPFQSSPFPLDPAFEMELYKATPLDDKELQKLTDKYSGSYNHWTGALIHVASKSRSDISYSAMRLSGYNNCPSQACYKALYQGMCYLYHHPLIPIMFPRTSITTDIPMKSHFSKGEAEVTNYDYTNHTGLESWSDSEMARDVLTRRSTTSAEHRFNSVPFAWQCTKQPEPGGSVNDSETRALYHTSRKTVWYRNILLSLKSPQIGPTPTFEDNKATIAQVIKDRLTPRIRHIDVLVAWMNEQFARERLAPVYTATMDNKADKNSKPHGGQTLQAKHLDTVGFSSYPPPDSEHYTLLQLDQYNIGKHRGSFLKEGVLPPL